MSEIKTDDTELFTNSNQSESNTDDDSGTKEQGSESSSEQNIFSEDKTDILIYRISLAHGKERKERRIMK